MSTQLLRKMADNEDMTPRLRWFLGRTCALASLAYAGRMKRLGNAYFVNAIAALYTACDAPIEVYRGPMPSRVQPRSQ